MMLLHGEILSQELENSDVFYKDNSSLMAMNSTYHEDPAFTSFFINLENNNRKRKSEEELIENSPDKKKL